MRGRISLQGGRRLGSFRFKLVAWFALLALLPLAVAFYGYDNLARRSENRRADASLEAALRVAVAGYAQQLDLAATIARRLAAEPRLQRALRGHDRSSLSVVAAGEPSTRISGGGLTVGSLPPFAAQRTVAIVDRGRTIGTVTVAVPIDDRLLTTIGVGLGAGERLVAVRNSHLVAGGPPSEPLAISPGKSARVMVAGTSSRGLSTSLAEPAGVQLVALTPQAAIDTAARMAEMRLTAVLIASLLVFALVVFLLGRSVVTTLGRLAGAADAIADGRLDERVDVRGQDEFAQLGSAFNRMAEQLQQQMTELRTERRRAHEATTRFGQALGATHDPQQLLRVVAETVVEATGASGAVVRTRTGEVLEAGESTGPEEVTFPLRVGASDFGSLVIRGSALDADQVETARALVAHAAVALENARLHRLVEQQALVDVLTGLANRRSLEETLTSELARARRLDGELCLSALRSRPLQADQRSFRSSRRRRGAPIVRAHARRCSSGRGRRRSLGRRGVRAHPRRHRRLGWDRPCRARTRAHLGASHHDRSRRSGEHHRELRRRGMRRRSAHRRFDCCSRFGPVRGQARGPEPGRGRRDDPISRLNSRAGKR